MATSESWPSTEPASPTGWPWFLQRWLGVLRGRPASAKTSSRPSARFRNLCISREAGAGGTAVARLVGTRLNWKVYDNELLEAIAHGMQIPTEEARTYDELAPSLVQDWFLPLREEHYAPLEAYLDHLAKLVESIGREGESILVGRGAAQLLPRSETLSVRLIAPIKDRAKKLSETMGVSLRTARRAAEDLDRRSARFVRTLHRVDVANPHNYDLVLDTQSLGLNLTSELIVRCVELGNPIRPAPTVSLVP